MKVRRRNDCKNFGLWIEFGILGICKVMDDYAKAKYKNSGKLTVLKMFLDGAMNPLMSGIILFVLFI